MWRVSSEDGLRWVQFDEAADEAGRVICQPVELAGDLIGALPVEVAPMSGQWYRPAGPVDPVAVFLRALRHVGGRTVVTGRPPAVPSVPAGPAGVVV